MNLIDKKYITLNVEEISKIDFDLVCENSDSTLRFSVNSIKTFVSWYGETPEFINTINSKSNIYTYFEILELLDGQEWNKDFKN
jgi:hypothetical protein